MTLAKEHAKELKAISFHGGEPFLYIKRIDQLMELLHPMFGDMVEYYIAIEATSIF
jgi:organic radical activating enzyme